MWLGWADWPGSGQAHSRAVVPSIHPRETRRLREGSWASTETLAAARSCCPSSGKEGYARNRTRHFPRRCLTLGAQRFAGRQRRWPGSVASGRGVPGCGVCGTPAGSRPADAPAQALRSVSKTTEPLRAQAPRLGRLVQSVCGEEIPKWTSGRSGHASVLPAHCHKWSLYLGLSGSRIGLLCASLPAQGLRPRSIPHSGPGKWNDSDIDYLTLLKQMAPRGIDVGRGCVPG